MSGLLDDLEYGIDPGIAEQVATLRSEGIETFESCEGGTGHAFPEPTVRFHGNQAEGLRALAVVQAYGARVSALRRVWAVCAPLRRS